PKGVDHTDRARDVGFDERAALVTPGQKLAGQDPAVDQVDGDAAGLEPAAPELQCPRLADHRLDPAALEVVAEELELGGGRKTGPVHDRDHRGSLLAPAAETAQHGAQLPRPRGKGPDAKALAEGAHHG